MCRFLQAVVHLAGFPFSVSAELGSRSRISDTYDIAVIFHFALHTVKSTELPEETAPLAKSNNVESANIIIWLKAGLLTVSGRSITDLVLEACFGMALVAFWDLWSSINYPLLGAGILHWMCGTASGYEGRDKALHSHSSNFPGHWAFGASITVLGSRSLYHLVYVQ